MVMKSLYNLLAIYESALCTFTDLVAEFILNFGRNMKLCLDSGVPELSTEVFSSLFI
jgi:hypothetical protein